MASHCENKISSDLAYPLKGAFSLRTYLKTPNNAVISQSLILLIILLIDIVGISLETNKHQNAIFWFILYFEVFFTFFFSIMCHQQVPANGQAETIKMRIIPIEDYKQR